MKTSRFTLTTTILLGLAVPGWSQTSPAAPKPTAVPQAQPGPAVVTPPTEKAEDIDLPKIEYPEAVTEEQKKAAAKHQEGSQKLAIEQDELAADVLGLIEEQTDEKVIQLLEEVEKIMAEVIDSLDQTDTSGGTIAAETEVIEKIFEAAQQKSQSSGST